MLFAFSRRQFIRKVYEMNSIILTFCVVFQFDNIASTTDRMLLMRKIDAALNVQGIEA